MNRRQQESDLKYTTRMWLLLVGIPLLSICAIAVVATAVEAAPYQPTDHVCFEAREWGPAADSVRPCVSLKANAPEGGAVRFAVKDASGVVRYTGFVNTTFRHIIHVRVVSLAEDGSFTWKARSQDGRTVTASVGNLQD